MLPGSNKYGLQLGVCCWSHSRRLISCGTKEPSLPSPPSSVVLSAPEQKSSSPAAVHAATQSSPSICWHSRRGLLPWVAPTAARSFDPGMRLQGLGKGSAASLSPKSSACVCQKCWGTGGVIQEATSSNRVSHSGLCLSTKVGRGWTPCSRQCWAQVVLTSTVSSVEPLGVGGLLERALGTFRQLSYLPPPPKGFRGRGIV